MVAGVVQADQTASVLAGQSSHPGVRGNPFCYDLGVSSEWSDCRPQFKGPRAPSESAILNHSPRSESAGEG